MKHCYQRPVPFFHHMTVFTAEINVALSSRVCSIFEDLQKILECINVYAIVIYDDAIFIYQCKIHCLVLAIKFYLSSFYRIININAILRTPAFLRLMKQG